MSASRKWPLLDLQPPRPGRLARHRHRREPLRPRLRHGPVQRRAQPERLHPHRLAGQHPHVMIDHRDRLLLLRQVDPDYRPVARQDLPKPLPSLVPPPVPSRRATTLAHRTPSCVAPGTPSPNNRTKRASLPQLPLEEQAPRGLRPITTGSQQRQTPGDARRRSATSGRTSWHFRRRQATSRDGSVAYYKRGVTGFEPSCAHQGQRPHRAPEPVTREQAPCRGAHCGQAPRAW